MKIQSQIEPWPLNLNSDCIVDVQEVSDSWQLLYIRSNNHWDALKCLGFNLCRVCCHFSFHPLVAPPPFLPFPPQTGCDPTCAAVCHLSARPAVVLYPPPRARYEPPPIRRAIKSHMTSDFLRAAGRSLIISCQSLFLPTCALRRSQNIKVSWWAGRLLL